MRGIGRTGIILGAFIFLGLVPGAVFLMSRGVLDQASAASSNEQLHRPVLSALERKTFTETVLRRNPDIFWAPASKSDNIVTKFGDEARAVFGPIPDADCGAADAKIIPREVDGNIVDLKPNPDKPGEPLEFAHQDESGKVVAWTTTLPKCDKPSLAGSATFCGLNSRIQRVVRSNVEWLFLCRKGHYSQEVSTDPYWLRSDPNFSVFGTIAFNKETGEIAFFDGRKDRYNFDWSEPIVPPGGRSYADSGERAAAEAFYDTTFRVPCHACHDNKGAYVINPHISQSRLGYGGDSKKAAAFGLGSFLPQRPRKADTPFRVVGSAYTKKYGSEIAQAKTVEDPTGNCTGCHTLTTLVTGQRFAADAVGREPTITLPGWVQLLRLKQEETIIADVAAHRTDWAMGRIHPWMTPASGNDRPSASTQISADDWRKLSDCIWEAGGKECRYRPLYTACPAPEADGERSAISDVQIEQLPAGSGEASQTRLIRLTWMYGNNYGGVPERDDVRINVAVSTRAIPVSGDAPPIELFPGVEDAKDAEVASIQYPVGFSRNGMLIQDVSFAGHTRWTDPAPTLDPRKFQLDLPAQCNQRVLIRLLPKRFCFDQSKIAYSPMDHLVYADVKCS